jgi:two-component system, chemotaxis family, protein-glutamate methylesterase/glutaminase
MSRRIRVAIVDDSALMRRMLSESLEAIPDFEVVGTAQDPYEARDMIKVARPDVLTLDVEMPRMDGLTFLEKIMTLRPMPVVMVSTLTKEGTEATVRALELGAIDYVGKPKGTDGDSFAEFRDELVLKLRLAAAARLNIPRAKPVRAAAPARRPGDRRMIAMGASTGGVERIRDVLEALSDTCPPIFIVQHIGAPFVASFAARLDRQTSLTVRVATHGARVGPGQAVIAPGDEHLSVRRDALGYICELSDGPAVSGHRPSAIGRCAVRVGCQGGRCERRRRHSQRHGPRRRHGDGGHEGGRRLDDRRERGELRRLWYAAHGKAGRRRCGRTAPEPDPR